MANSKEAQKYHYIKKQSHSIKIVHSPKDVTINRQKVKVPCNNKAYETEWELKFPWMKYDQCHERPICTVCNHLLSFEKRDILKHERSMKHNRNIANRSIDTQLCEGSEQQPRQRITSPASYRYNREWEFMYPWLQQDKRTELPWCVVCQQLLSHANHHFRRHEATEKHKENINQHPDGKKFLQKQQDYKAMRSDQITETKLFRRHYRHSWELSYRWVKRDPETNRPFCLICNQLLGRQNCHLKRHEQTQKHIQRTAKSDFKQLLPTTPKDVSADQNRIADNNAIIPINENNEVNYDSVKKVQRQYNREWEFIYPWVQCDLRTNRPLCKICNQLLGRQKGHLSRHENTIKHQENLSNQNVAEKIANEDNNDDNDDGNDAGCLDQINGGDNSAMVTLETLTSVSLYQMTLSNTVRSAIAMKELDAMIVCRICLQGEEDEDMNSIYDIDTADKTLKIYQKIERCGGIEIIDEPELPTRICRKCNMFLTIAHKFRVICQLSDGYLRQFVCKSATEASGSQTNVTLKNSRKDSATLPQHYQQEERSYRKEQPSKGRQAGKPQQNKSGGRITRSTGKEKNSVAANEAQQKLAVSSQQPAMEVEVKNEDLNQIEEGIEVVTTEEYTEFWPDELNDNVEFIDDIVADDEDQFNEHHADNNDDADVPIQNTDDNNADLDVDEDEENNSASDSSNHTDDFSPFPSKTLGISSDGAAVISMTDHRPNAKEKHVCDVCGNTYPRRYALESHMKWHSDEKPFECEICQARFHMNFQLVRHIRRHTGVRPFSCQYCQRTFTDRSTMVKHERIHRNERPYVCPTCGKSFSYSSVLKAHILTHTGEKPYGCGICGKRFTRAHHLRAHLETQMHSSDPRSKELLKRIKPEDDSNCITAEA